MSPRRRHDACWVSLRHFETLLDTEASTKWAIADALVELVDRHGFRFASLAQRYGRRRNTLSGYYHCAKTFAQDQRDVGISFAAYENARQAAKKFGFEPLWCLRQICAAGLTQRRDVTRHFASIKREQDAAAVLATSSSDEPLLAGIVGRCHRADCRQIAKLLPDASVKLANLDLPYGPYGRYVDGKHEEFGLTRKECDGNSEESVLKLLDDLLHLLEPKMKPGGSALLYRPGGFHDSLYTAIGESSMKHGWGIEHVLTWDKGRTQLARADAPYATRTESIYVLARSGDRLVNHDGSCRDNILRVSAARYPRGDEHNHHLFEKPTGLCEVLLGKHTYPGDLVFDACGCSGNLCIAAEKLGRRWVYCESHAVNFEWGKSRIAKRAGY